MSRKIVRQLSVLVVLLGLLGALILYRQPLVDWVKLRGYTPPQNVATLASQTTMTDKAKHLLYVNHPDITSSQAFSVHCPAGDEKTVVLGCYVGNDGGIYIYDVTDQRLDGVEQVTAAHEMLHAAYRRLSASERTKVNALLMNYYQHDLADQRIKDTIAAYKKSEPNDVINEMHSIFGTEIAILPPALEGYYKQYFTDRQKVATYTATYQGEFTSRQAKVASYDAQLAGLKQQIQTNESRLTTQRTALNSQANRMQSERKSGQTSQYNSEVPAYNLAVNQYNAQLTDTRSLINQYNDIVAARNQIALEEQQLAQELSASSLPSN